MKIFEFLITDKDGNTRTESIGVNDEREETAYSTAIRMWPGSDIRLRKDIEYRWYYMALGFGVGCVAISLAIGIFLHISGYHF